MVRLDIAVKLLLPELLHLILRWGFDVKLDITVDNFQFLCHCRHFEGKNTIKKAKIPP